MDVKPGYRLTESGIFPTEWDIVPLKDVSSMHGRIGWQGLKQSEFTMNPDQPFLITGMNFKDGEIRWDEVYHIPNERYEIAKEIQLKSGDVLMTKDGTIGKILYVDQIPYPGKASLNSHLLVFRPINKKYVPRFLYYQLQSRSFLNHVELEKSGSTFFGITQEAVGKYKAYFPPVHEQEAIAEALSDADAYIENLEQLIAKKRLIKQGAMQELLEPKDGWMEKKLGNTATLKARIGWQGLTTAEYLDSGDYFLVTGTEFRDGYIDWDSCHYVSESRYKQDKNIQLKKHDVLVTKDGTIGKVALVTKMEKPATLNSGVFVIRPINNSFHPQFFYYLLLSEVFTEFLNQLSAGSTINHLYQKDFVNFVYRTPKTISEQETIASVIRDMDEEISLLEKKLSKARQLKLGMMQELLTGRIRLI